MSEFEPPQLSSVEVLPYLRGSADRAIGLARLALKNDEPTPLERLRSEKRVYLSYLDEFREAVLDRRVL